MRCGKCGSKNIEFKNAKGKNFPILNYEKVKLDDDLIVRTCLDCDNIILSTKDVIELDNKLLKSISIKNNI